MEDYTVNDTIHLPILPYVFSAQHVLHDVGLILTTRLYWLNITLACIFVVRYCRMDVYIKGVVKVVTEL